MDLFMLKVKIFSGKTVKPGDSGNSCPYPSNMLSHMYNAFLFASLYCPNPLHMLLFPRKDRDVYTITAGVHNISAYDPLRALPQSAQVRQKATIILHPGYNKTSWDNDIALLLVDEPFVFNSYVQPVCVTHQAPPEGFDCLTSGWGITGK